MVALLRELYEGSSTAARRLRWLLLGFDLLVVGFFVITTFLSHAPWVVTVDYVLGLYYLLDFIGRLAASRERLNHLVKPIVIVDIVVVLTLFAPAVAESFVFLRVLRTLRLLRSYHVLRELRGSSPYFARHEAVIFSALNLLVFIFVVAALVYVLQVRSNPQILDYVDALYFTVTTLTTTGFGDITLTGPVGRMLSVLIMIIGVSLFLRLIQTIFRPNRVSFECPDCGLNRHDRDAVHCKHCGRLLHIPNEGG